jgi:hypothetical protein
MAAVHRVKESQGWLRFIGSGMATAHREGQLIESGMAEVQRNRDGYSS